MTDPTDTPRGAGETEKHACCHAPQPVEPRPRPRKAWYCPMCPGVESDEPGTCPICGMALEPTDPAAADERERRSMERRFLGGAVLALPVVVLAMGAHLPGVAAVPAALSLWIQFALATPVVGIAGWPLWQRGLRSFRPGARLNMFSLIVLGVGAAYGFSLWSLFAVTTGRAATAPVYFEAAAVITVLVLLGQALELRARAGTGAAIRALMNLAPPVAVKVEADGEREVPLAEVLVGDRLRVKPGAKVPVDGVIESGAGAVDESMLTGESMPVRRQPGDSLAAGTLNGEGSLILRAERVGADTLLARIVAMVAEAQRSRAPIQRLADAVSAWFVPAVLVFAVVTFVLWLFLGGQGPGFALTQAVAVLIIACPCALGLATPMSIMVAVGRGAGSGVLVREAAALEVLGRVTVVAVDKTGTLTEGHPRLTALESAGDTPLDELLALTASLEQASEHPLAAAVVRAARERNLDLGAVEDFSAVPGCGVRGRVNGRALRAGSSRWLAEDLPLPEGLTAAARQAEEAGQTVLWLATDAAALGWIALSDPIKPTAASAIAGLHARGVRVVMLTGDNARVAGRVARTLGLDEFTAEVTPAGKLAAVRSLRAGGAVVAMAGDGVNDAPALAAADVGLAMGTGTDAAMHSAGVTLVKGDLRGIGQALALGRATMANIRQNLFFAFAYNALGVPIAAGALYPWLGWTLDPMLASAAMALSSVCVVANALRLRKADLQSPVADSPPGLKLTAL